MEECDWSSICMARTLEIHSLENFCYLLLYSKTSLMDNIETPSTPEIKPINRWASLVGSNLMRDAVDLVEDVIEDGDEQIDEEYVGH